MSLPFSDPSNNLAGGSALRPSPEREPRADESGRTTPSGAPRGPRDVASTRLPLLMRLLAIVSLLLGLWGTMTSLAEVNGAVLLNRDTFVLRSRDRQMMLFDQFQAQKQETAPGQQAQPAQTGQDILRPFLGPFLKLPRAEAERLSLLLADALYERRGVTVPLGVLQLILSWLLISGALAVLRRQTWGLATWSFACWASIFFALLCMLVTFVHSRTLMGRLGQGVADALAKANGQSLETALAELWQMTRLYVVMRAAFEGLWVLLLGLTALYLQRHLHAQAQAPAAERERPAR